MSGYTGIIGKLSALAFGVAVLAAPAIQAQQQPAEPAYVCGDSTAQYDDATQYVDCNTKLVLDILNDKSLTPELRTEQFDGYMDEFADIKRVAKFTLGSRYTRKITPEELGRFTDAFRSNMLMVYQVQLDQMRGDKIEVIKTVEKKPGREAIVITEVSRQGQVVTESHWRIMNFGKGWQVVDVALEFDGQLLWLAIEQRLFHLAILSQNNGSIDALISEIEASTLSLREGMAANETTL